MSDVPTLEVSLQEKRQRDYNPQLDMDMRKWVAAFLGVDVDLSPSTSFASIFKDGILLCRIINKIKPGTIPEPARTGLAFKQMVRGLPFVCVSRLFLSLHFILRHFEIIDLCRGRIW
jgi:acetolactate synthase small subunit